MTNEELDCARVEEAWNKYNTGHTYDTVELIAARLAREGWTPPKVVVDPDLAEATILYNRHHASFEGLEETLFTAIKRGRELERAVMGNPIPEQIQEVTPPEPVNPDLLLARKIEACRLGVPPTVSNAILHGAHDGDIEIERTLETIKRGRELERAEAKPGLVWVKHDFATAQRHPDRSQQMVCVEYSSGSFAADFGVNIYWPNVTHYAIITPPAEDVA